MAWAERETAPESTFAVIGYPVDRGFVEWFPALSGRENVTTWQGTEWRPLGSRRDEAVVWAECEEASCLPDADYYIVREGCCAAVTDTLVAVRPGVYRRD